MSLPSDTRTSVRVMQAEVLEALLRRGLSLQAIATLTGRDATTVGYWVKRHGLSAVHRDRHAHKGGVELGGSPAWSMRDCRLARSPSALALAQSTVRRWLRRHGSANPSGTACGLSRYSRARCGSKVMRCPRHGETSFWLEKRGIYRCLRCRSEAVSRRRRRLKELAVAEAGGRCALCGYDRCVGALQFQRLRLDLADALAGHAHLVADVLEGHRALVAQAVAQLDHAALAPRERLEHLLQVGVAQRLATISSGRSPAASSMKSPSEASPSSPPTGASSGHRLLAQLQDLLDLLRGHLHELADLLGGRRLAVVPGAASASRAPPCSCARPCARGSGSCATGRRARA